MKSFFKGSIVALAAICFLAGATSLWGQAGSSAIRGTVTDQTGAIVPGATVTISNAKIGLTRTQTSSAAGTFSFDLISPGEYKVEVEAKGFRKKVINTVRALVANTADVVAQLEVGELTSVVEVSAEQAAVAVNTQDATLGNNFVTNQIVQLPLEARNIQSLLTLQPAVTRDGFVAGARSDQSNITLDGVDINEVQTNSLGSPVLRPNSEAIEEFRVNTVNANADQGRSSAAQISLVTKSGTNEIHGALFYYHRNTIFTANDFFNNRSTPFVDRPKLIRNTFGGAVGGPVVKDRVFFFYSYEGRIDASGVTLTSIVPRPFHATGNTSVRYQVCTSVGVGCTTFTRVSNTAELNQIFSAVGINPVAVSTLTAAAAAYPVNSNAQGDGIHTGEFRFNAPRSADLNSNVARLDWSINRNMTLYGRVQYVFDSEVNPPGTTQAFPDSPVPTNWSHPLGYVVSHNWAITQNVVNNFRYGLTRLGFSNQGDSAENNISFRATFSPRNFSRTLDRTTPLHNIVNDTSWVKGNHAFNFGTNLRIARNNRAAFTNAFDTAITNGFFYVLNGTSSAGGRYQAFLQTVHPGMFVSLPLNLTDIRHASAALVGRYSQYTSRFTFDANGQLLSAGSPTARKFATEEFDFYGQDNWRIGRELNLTLGLRYGVSRPVREGGGFGVVTDISTAEYLRLRAESAATGVPFIDPITLERAGGDGKGNLYNFDKNNFQPRVAVAWTPSFETSWLRKIFGDAGKSVFRGGFAITNDYYGQALAVQFDLANTLGYTSSFNISANTFNYTNRPAPLFTGFNQDVRTLPNVVVPGAVSFPRLQPSDLRRRIESSVDTELTAPINYTWNFTIERELPHRLVVQASYIARLARNLLVQRDVMALNNLVDPVSGVDWYTAATQLEVLRQAGTPRANVQAIPWFQNVLPANYAQLLFNCCGYFSDANGNFIGQGVTNTQAVYEQADVVWKNDWTDTQDEMEFATGLPLFFNPQYGALNAWGTVGNSNYHGATLSIRQRLRDLTWDFNYTLSHSLDDGSALQNVAAFNGFILNPFRQRDSYGSSGFDIRHMININGIYQMPFGKGKMIGGNVGKGWDYIIGGWQLAGIFRWNTGLPINSPSDASSWATNWNLTSRGTAIQPVTTCATRGTATAAPNLFGCGTLAAYNSFRNAYPGESGPRSVFRFPGFVNMDASLSKYITITERVKFQLRWEVFNVTNTQRMTGLAAFSLNDLPQIAPGLPTGSWGNFTGIQGSPRVMQVGGRLEF